MCSRNATPCSLVKLLLVEAGISEQDAIGSLGETVLDAAVLRFRLAIIAGTLAQTGSSSSSAHSFGQRRRPE